MLIYDIKTLPGMEEIEDAVLNIYIKRAIVSIKNYLNNDNLELEDIRELYSDAIISMVTDITNSQSNGDREVKSVTQGARSITYADNSSRVSMSSDTKSLLPLPYLKMRGGNGVL